ncbi:transcriptional regulator [Hahella sp. CCB-MM4]|uniref:ArsR/SmtB family transcription factor n=1 Tax=Hahella sp. (strain CCB-MM4) TaxID=1926491 RepID=UPI000B9B2CE1|nr:metalloregulator ArsR/SmtB family transcription factor [Hahella sp. CCB-MM4]OZG73110.1 transcriptional regulator [Hahella sp. CCB-MM4]
MNESITEELGELARLAENAKEAAGLLKAMANENRLMILCSLLERELPVGELNARVPLSQSALSQHLAALRKAGLVNTRKEAQTIWYRLEGTAAQQVISVLKDQFCAAD